MVVLTLAMQYGVGTGCRVSVKSLGEFFLDAIWRLHRILLFTYLSVVLGTSNEKSSTKNHETKSLNAFRNLYLFSSQFLHQSIFYIINSPCV